MLPLDNHEIAMEVYVVMLAATISLAAQEHNTKHHH
jgi:hypothetical protein